MNAHNMNEMELDDIHPAANDQRRAPHHIPVHLNHMVYYGQDILQAQVDIAALVALLMAQGILPRPAPIDARPGVIATIRAIILKHPKAVDFVYKAATLVIQGMTLSTLLGGQIHNSLASDVVDADVVSSLRAFYPRGEAACFTIIIAFALTIHYIFGHRTVDL